MQQTEGKLLRDPEPKTTQQDSAPVESVDNEGKEYVLPALGNLPAAWKLRQPVVSQDADKVVTMQPMTVANALQARRASIRGNTLVEGVYQREVLARTIIKIGGQKASYAQVMAFLDSIGKPNYEFLRVASARVSFVKAEALARMKRDAKDRGAETTFRLPAEALAPRWQARRPIASLEADMEFVWRDATVGEEIDLESKPLTGGLDAMLAQLGESGTGKRSEVLEEPLFRKLLLSVRTIGGKHASEEEKAQWVEDMGWPAATILTTIYGSRSQVPEDDQDRFRDFLVNM